MFRRSWVHPQGDSCIRSMCCFTCVGVSSLVGNRVKKAHCPNPPDCSHRCMKTYNTAYRAVFLRMNSRGSKRVGDNAN